MSPTSFLAIGHRGARGSYPENTLPAFEHAILLGAEELELDVVISKDGKVVVSHEAWMNPVICTAPDGRPIDGPRENWNLFQMTYDEIRRFDCGAKRHPDFPDQKKIPTYKPLLSEMLRHCDDFASHHWLTAPHYLIEIKSGDDSDGLFNPPPTEFVKLVLSVLDQHRVLSRTRLQSFDPRILTEIKRINPSVPLALLVENKNSFKDNLDLLDFVPETYSPDYTFVTATLSEEVKAKKMQLIPWTVNETVDMNRLLALGVDGLISDYPERLTNLKQKTK